MNPGRFYIPGNMGIGPSMMNSGMMGNMMSSGPILRMAGSAPRGMGLFSKITNGIRSVNWGGLLNNANKTLNVVNQTIPLVRQAGPMFNNMKSIVRIARAFGNETTGRRNNNMNNRQVVNSSENMNDRNIYNNSNDSLNNSSIENNINDNISQKKEVVNDSVPNFFV